MDPDRIKELLQQVARGDTNVDDAMSKLRDLPFSDLGFAHLDHHRALRTGFPEVVFGQGKTIDQIRAIVHELDGRGSPVLVTRVSENVQSALEESFEEIRCDRTARTALLSRGPTKVRGRGTICIVTGGTSDIPVAEEAAVTARAFGNEVARLYDVGVAGIHRLLHKRNLIQDAEVVIAVAGMEGALASVVGGLTSKPVIAVPTSVGYGAHFEGMASLLAMLNSCASGVTVVNIDNGFGAAYAASLINRVTDR